MSTTATAITPAVYWTSSPNLPTDTVTLAGSFDGNETVELCSPTGCVAAAHADVWRHSIKVTLPAQLPCPAWLAITPPSHTHDAAQLDAATQSTLAPAATAVRSPINAPDVWFTMLLQEGLPVLATDPVHNGAVLRAFGRSLGWSVSNGKCLDARHQVATSTTTSLVLVPAGRAPQGANTHATNGHRSSAGTTTLHGLNVSCFESAFVLTGVPQGNYAATIVTPWGSSASWHIWIAGTTSGGGGGGGGGFRAPALGRPTINVDSAFAGDIAFALAHAATLPSGAVVQLSGHVYNLTAALAIPDNTLLVGVGARAGTSAGAGTPHRRKPAAATTVLQFDLARAPVQQEGCSVPIPKLDLWKAGSTHLHDLAYIKGISTIGACCAQCAVNPSCNGYTLMLAEHQCILKTCDLPDAGSCIAGLGAEDIDRVSGFLAPFRSVSGAAKAAITTAPNATGWGLEAVTLVIVSALPATYGVLAQGSDFAMRSVAIHLHQTNVSSAVKVDRARRFEITDSLMVQHNLCFWGPKGGMHDANTPFPDSSTLQMHNASTGFVHDNTLLWKCSGYDMDVSSNIIFEHNNITATEAGVLPHGNSISFYDYAHVPTSANWSFSHNHMARPPKNDPHNWAFHETLTGDGSGGFGAGYVDTLSADGMSVTLAASFTLRSQARGPVGGTAMVCGGLGVGQSSIIVKVESAANLNQTVLFLATPFDGNVVGGGRSTLCLTATVGSKIVSGNSFNNGMVVQWFGTTTRGVISDNDFTDMNVCSSGYGCKSGDGALEGFGLCYNGPQPLWMAEYSGNTMVRSNGITLKDGLASTPVCNSSTYGGPFTRWQVIRRNSIGGVADSQTVCGTISLSGGGVSTDVVVEHNTFDCPAGKTQPPIAVNCSHCHVQLD